jgi:hypothetical protein
MKLARLFQQHVEVAAGKLGVEGALAAGDGGLQDLQTLGLQFVGHLLHLGCRRAGARRIHEGVGAGEFRLVHQRERVAELRFALAGEADDEVGGEGKIGPSGTQARDDGHVVLARMPPVHRRQNAVGAGLHRQMHIGHQRRELAMGGDEAVIHVARMASGVAQSQNARHAREPAQQFAERGGRAVFARPVIGVDVLPDQRQLAHAGGGQPLDFRDDLRDRARHFGAARIGHDTEGAKLVAAFLHGDEGGNAARTGRLARGRRQPFELVIDRKLGVDHLFAALGARDQFGQAVIVLRADHQIDGAGAADDLPPLGLRDAAGDRDQHAAALASGFLLHDADAADLGIDLLGRLLADVAGVEDDEVGVLRRPGLGEAGRRQRVRHTMGIVDVHLAAEGLDVDSAGSAHAALRSNRSANLACSAKACRANPYN